ncbi:hypothetical protein ACFPRL_28175 [Pseudoclavibacter helvolus]
MRSSFSRSTARVSSFCSSTIAILPPCYLSNSASTTSSSSS